MVCIGAISFAFIQLEFVQILEALDLSLSPNLENFNYFKISGFWEYFYIYQRRYKGSIEFPHTYYPDSPIVNILHIIMVYLLNYKSNVGTMPLTIGFPLMFFFFCFRNPVQDSTLHFILISLSLLQSVTVFQNLFAFYGHDTFEEYGQVFFRMSLDVGLSDVFSCLD